MSAAFDTTPTQGASTYVKPQDIEWAPSQFEGLQIKVHVDNKA